MKASITGFPRIGSLRELKFATESYFQNKITAEELNEKAKALRLINLNYQNDNGIDFISSNDFSFYDNVLDTAFLLNAIPSEYKNLQISPLDKYFAMARGRQDGNNDVKALPMKKWFNTNYHYIVPALEDSTQIKLNDEKPFELFTEAKNAGIKTKAHLIGPFTFLSLADYRGDKKAEDFVDDVVNAYAEIFKKLSDLGAEWVQIDEPFLVTDLTQKDIKLFENIYNKLLNNKSGLKVILSTYFGDIRDAYNEVTSQNFDAIALDFLEGEKTFELIKKNGFPKDKLLFAGVLNGKNIWKNNYAKTLSLLNDIAKIVPKENIVLSTSCSLLHVPYTLRHEDKLAEDIKIHFAFAEEKTVELKELKELFDKDDYSTESSYIQNALLFKKKSVIFDEKVRGDIAALKDSDFVRLPAFAEREAIQREVLKLPLYPTTTIGSFPQTAEVKSNRAKLKSGEITDVQYKENVKAKIAECIKLQEEIGIDVLVHGEFERNDMVEHFGENLSGYVFTSKAWVQSYGTRCVKPPIIWSDVKREKSITVEYSKYAQSLTNKPVKGMLTGPVTILNWSFPREDISNKEMAYQIALAIKEEVLDLEANGIKIIQIDEAALKEKLPIRCADWHTEYLDWAIAAFRLVHSSVKPETQIHTHMCYSEFAEIITDIDEMDADVISFEASRSQLTIIDALNDAGFKTQVGPGVYDIHSPRIPTVDEVESAIETMLKNGKINAQKLWINPDCGLKTRGEYETVESLKNMVQAVKRVRNGSGE